MLERAAAIRDELTASGLRTRMDDADKSPGWKFAEQEMRGNPVRIELGPKDLEAGHAVVVRRDTREKQVVAFEELADTVKKTLETMQKDMLERARAHRDAHTYTAVTKEEFKDMAEHKPGFIKAMWCGSQECEDALKEECGVTSRCMPFEQEHISDTCICCGKPAKKNGILGESLLRLSLFSAQNPEADQKEKDAVFFVCSICTLLRSYFFLFFDSTGNFFALSSRSCKGIRGFRDQKNGKFICKIPCST